MAQRKRRGQSSVKIHYVASTHWDREWYEPFQHYRFRLVDVIDAALDLLERDPRYAAYQLDGQTCVLDDYFEMRPENRARLNALAHAGRIEVGPWYVMPDEFLPSGESLVRNLLRGRRLAAEFGGAMRVGFVCDIFGHNSQLPQIFRGFGLDVAVVWRGTNEGHHPGLFRWQAADGSEVLAYTFENRGYGQYHFEVRMPAEERAGKFDIERGIAGLRKAAAFEQQRVPGRVVLLHDGMDHIPPQPATPDLLDAARAAGVDVEHTTLRGFFDAVLREKLKLQTFAGELREPATRMGAMIPGVLSSRLPIKQQNAHCEALLTRWAEPFGVFAAALGAEYLTSFLDRAWRYLLQNHPHDSICGCSIDQVHQDMHYRFDQCRLIAERCTQISLRHIVDRTPLPKLADDEDFAVTVFNASTSERDEIIDLPLYFQRNTQNRFQEWFGYEEIVGFRVYDADGKELPVQRLQVDKAVPVKSYDRVVGYRGEKYEQVQVALPLKLPPMGWTTLVCRPTKERTRSAGTQLIDDHTMENEHLRVQINPNGTLDVTDRATDHTYRDLMTFEERADIGDGWYHGTAVNDAWFTSHGAQADIALVHDGFALTTFRVRVVLHVPAQFLHDRKRMHRSADLADLVITSWITLRRDVRRVEVRTEVENTVRDHRLRVLFPTGVAADTYFADSPFDVVERPIALRPDSHLLFEQEVETKPQYTFTAVNDGQRGLAIVTTGQPESAVRDLPERPIALTLLRGFARTVAAEGEQGGQILGRHVHRYWIVPHDGPLPRTALCQLGTQLAAGVECVYTERWRQQRPRRPRPVLPATGSWLDASAGPLVVTACKQAEDGAGFIVRLFNPTAETAQQRLRFCTKVRSAAQVDLAEQPVEKLTPRGQNLSLTAGPKQIVTLRIELDKLTRNP